MADPLVPRLLAVDRRQLLVDRWQQVEGRLRPAAHRPHPVADHPGEPSRRDRLVLPVPRAPANST